MITMKYSDYKPCYTDVSKYGDTVTVAVVTNGKKQMGCSDKPRILPVQVFMGYHFSKWYLF